MKWLIKLGFLALLAPSLSANEIETSDPYVFVEQNMTQLLEIISQKREQYKADKSQFYMDVDDALEPLIAFERISRGVMGRYYKQANSQQRDKFTEVFRRSLLSTYAGALLDYEGYAFKMAEKSPKDIKGDKARVRLFVITEGGQEVGIQYSVFKDSATTWKVKNVIIEGFNVGLTFRNQFAESMKELKSLDNVISNWDTEINTDAKAA